MIKEHERIVLKVPVPGKGLEKGDVGPSCTFIRTVRLTKWSSSLSMEKPRR